MDLQTHITTQPGTIVRTHLPAIPVAEPAAAPRERALPAAEPWIDGEQHHHYVHAALCFARAISMPDVKWTETRTIKALSDLDLYFRTTKDMDKAFLTFCDRAIWAGVYASVVGSTANARWNCLVHPGGVSSNPDFQASPQKLLSLKRKNPFYQDGLPLVITAYVQYMRKPDTRIIAALKDQLDALGYSEHMDIFYAAINGEQGS